MPNQQKTRLFSPKKTGQDVQSPGRPGLEHLTDITHERAKVSAKYTRFIRAMRLILPLLAAALVVTVLTWSDLEEPLTTLAGQDAVPGIASMKNELLSPRFESADNKKRPFTITATRALQSQSNPDLIELEAPMADMTLESGVWIAAEAAEGTYEQQTEKLMLSQNVKLFHDKGYELHTDELRLNIKTGQAWSDRPVYLQGPEGVIRADGLDADSQAGRLIFKGPAALTLTDISSSGGDRPDNTFSLEDMTP